MIDTLGHEINMDPIAHREKPKQKRMRSFALVSITDILEQLEKGKLIDVIQELKLLHEKESRGHVLSEKEMLTATSRILQDASENQDDLTDKMLRIFWSNSDGILKRHEVVQ